MAFTEHRRAYHDYEILEKIEAGLKLAGFEVKSITSGRASLQGARVIIRGEEAFLTGAHIPPYQEANTPKGYESDRVRKLLLHKKEIAYLIGKEHERGLTFVPLRLYNNHRKIKLEFAIARGKKQHDKRDTIKKRDAKRQQERTLKNY